MRLQKKKKKFQGERIFEAIFNYSIISPPLVLKPQSVEIGGGVFSGEYGTIIRDPNFIA